MSTSQFRTLDLKCWFMVRACGGGVVGVGIIYLSICLFIMLQNPEWGLVCDVSG
jgi:hypothetical protein